MTALAREPAPPPVHAITRLGFNAEQLAKAWILAPKDPLAWAVKRFPDRHLWSKQRAIFESVRDNRRTAVRSCHGVGKSWTSAMVAAWWVDAWPADEVLVVSTAPTAAQVGAILWHEIRKARREGDLPGKIGLDNVWRIGDTMVGLGRKPADHDVHGFQGLHRRRVLVIVDEACHDADTEVMTEHGWLPFASLTGDERLLTLNTDTMATSWQEPSRLIRRPYQGQMVKYQSRGADWMVTPDHDMLVRQLNSDTPWEKRKASDLTAGLEYLDGDGLPRTYTPELAELVDYDGIVYCATVPDGTLLTRRNGHTLWSGNCGVPQQLWTAFEAVTTNDDCRILAIGNPDDPSTEFASVCKPGSGWNVIEISAFDSPNLTGEEVPDELRKMLVSADWVEDKRKRWGEQSPRYQSKVLGRFPELGDDTLIAPSWIEAAQQRTLPTEGKVRVSVDVARYGSDETVIGIAHGPVFRVAATLAASSTGEVVGEATMVMRTNGNCDVIVDGAGVGGGTVDGLRENVTKGVFGRARPTVREFLAGGKAKDEKEFANARSEAWWRLREMFREGEVDIDPADDELAAQVGSIKYGFDSKGRIKVESKDDMAKRGLPSPDRGDALMQAYAITGQDTPKVIRTAALTRRVSNRPR